MLGVTIKGSNDWSGTDRMDYELVLVPPGGGETDYSILMEDAPYVPRVGEYVIVGKDREDEQLGEVSGAFRVLCVQTMATRDLQVASDAVVTDIYVQAVPVTHPARTEAHERVCEIYRVRGKPLEASPESGY
jgi:hypothetical protein